MSQNKKQRELTIDSDAKLFRRFTAGETQTAIARSMGVSVSAIGRRIRRHEQQNGLIPKALAAEIENANRLHDFKISGMSYAEISDKTGLSEAEAEDWCNYAVEQKKRLEGAEEKAKRDIERQAVDTLDVGLDRLTFSVALANSIDLAMSSLPGENTVRKLVDWGIWNLAKQKFVGRGRMAELKETLLVFGVAPDLLDKPISEIKSGWCRCPTCGTTVKNERLSGYPR